MVRNNILALIILLSLQNQSFSKEIIKLEASDTKGDPGESITLNWKLLLQEVKDDVVYEIYRKDKDDKTFKKISAVSNKVSYIDIPKTDMGHEVKDKVDYYYQIKGVVDKEVVESNIAGPIQSQFNWFNTTRINALLLFLIFSAVVIYLIGRARQGKKFYIRKIAGLDAIDEAVGRATEMGKKILYIPGIATLDEIQTIASISILKYIAEYAAEYKTKFEVPNKDPLTFVAAREAVKEAFYIAGKPEEYKEDMVTYITYDQFAYTAAVTGKMLREKPACNFFLGSFYAESLLLAETGNITGAIQIAGTAETHQLPFFICACDYTLIGEELYAASAYLSNEPIMVGTIRGQDIVKGLLIGITISGIILEAFGIHWLTNFLKI